MTCCRECLCSLGTAYSGMEDYTKVKDVLERALEIKVKHFGPDHFEVAATVTNLGSAYDRLGEYSKAKVLFERTLKKEQQHYGPDHLRNLGPDHFSSGEHLVEPGQCVLTAR